ncbi:hypothetical protein Taro_017402 [Colocasia esculenta]|uniref:Methyltransferase n=1 Tax=Colocasia esculenta TaxID=4460 RepID=A0A843UN06_COLES|nr:hypothetical protein [Colocasia esculenta]
MASGKNPRMDRRSSSSYCSTVTLVVFVALCLVGVWMMTSSAVVPIDVSTPDNKSDVKEPLTQTDKAFEDSSGDVQEEVAKSDIRTSVKDAQEVTNADASQEQSLTEKQNESQMVETQEVNTSKENEDPKNVFFEASQTYSDTNGNDEGADANKDGEQGDGQSKPVEQNSDETRETEQNANESAKNEQEQSEKEAKSDGGEKADGVQDENSQAGIQEKMEEKAEEKVEEKAEEKQESETETNSEENKTDDKPKDQSLNEVFPDGAQSDLLNETTTQNGAFSTQATESKNEKEAQTSSSSGQTVGYSWKLCNVTAGADYIPCLDNEDAIRKLRSTKHYEHRERHCPEEGPTCLVPVPEGYKQPIKWPQSRDKIWYFNVPHTKLAEVKGHQNWVKVTGEYLTFPGGGTQFKHGALHYIDFIQESLPDIAWGKRNRVILDVGCGVASFGGFLFDRDVLAMSFAPKDEHEAQVQFALERGIPAISAVMGTKRLPFPSKVFDIVHCARCRVPWHIEGGTLLLELNRLLRPGGYFVWSATPVYQKLPEDVEIWKGWPSIMPLESNINRERQNTFVPNNLGFSE